MRRRGLLFDRLEPPRCVQTPNDGVRVVGTLEAVKMGQRPGRVGPPARCQAVFHQPAVEMDLVIEPHEAVISGDDERIGCRIDHGADGLHRLIGGDETPADQAVVIAEEVVLRLVHFGLIGEEEVERHRADGARLRTRDERGQAFELVFEGLWIEVGVFVGFARPESRLTIEKESRGISSGDLDLHALYQLVEESGPTPAIAARVGLQFPTGLDSKGTDLHLAALATSSFDAFRIHANVRYTRLGAISGHERRDRYEGVLGSDFLLPNGSTDTVLMADFSARSNPLLASETIYQLEAGARQRIGSQTLLFFGAERS